MNHQYKVEIEYPVLQPISATTSKDGQFAVVDFLHMQDQSKALRLLIPSMQIEDLVHALLQIQKAIADPMSGIHYQDRH
jgi:hypothetical protein